MNGRADASDRKKVVIAGASGFIGQHLGRALNDAYDVIGLSRVPKPAGTSGIKEWRTCDLLSLVDTEAALEGADFAYFLVHSMMPSTRLSQGDFWDFDLIAADNFARAARQKGVKQIIYLGGLVPSSPTLSHHLRSRFEVEQALRSHSVPLTTLRAGLVIGPEGSSFQTIFRLVERLPALCCPSWGDTVTHPIALSDVVLLLRFCLENEKTYNGTFDVGGPELMSYRSMLQSISRCLGLNKPVVSVPINSTRLIQHFVTLVTGAPRELVEPLIESLKYPMLARDRRLQEMANLPGMRFDESVCLAKQVLQLQAPADPLAYQTGKDRAVSSFSVRSVQRFQVPEGKNAEWVAREYLTWLPKWMNILLAIEERENELFRISFRPVRRLPLLILQRSPNRSWPDRQLFYVKGGLLSKTEGRGRLEFRKVLDGEAVLAAIHDYRPALAWPVYKVSQAKLHLIIMRSFKRHLEKVARKKNKSSV
ncbi:MAG TPA: NAD-dependent epimerase/dehydratase family protein [Bdellovibrionota bacterium]|nr:NAD-dependent epimerase/dehydratase family protein [Bdellovibrionota bacterium]